MTSHNPNCDGDKCMSSTGQVRILPHGDSNLILCRYCAWLENLNRKRLNRNLSKDAQWDIPKWETLKVYHPGG